MKWLIHIAVFIALVAIMTTFTIMLEGQSRIIRAIPSGIGVFVWVFLVDKINKTFCNSKFRE